MQTLTNIESNFIYTDNKSKVTDESLNNGDLAFCSEDKSITLKYDNDLYRMGGEEIADASNTVKGITKLSDAIDRDDSTIAATSKAIKTTYDEATSAKNKANEAYSLGESLTSRIEVIEDKVLRYDGPVLGVACTGEYTEDGATLAWIDGNFNEVTKLTDNYFDNHPSFKFEETIFGSDEMIKIPLCYWWRGTIPSGPFKDQWGMLLSPTANPISGLAFKPNYVAFMNKGTLMNQFYCGKYMARNVSNVPISQYDADDFYISSLIDARTLAANKGTGWHVRTLQEYHDIMARAVIEKKTFNIIPQMDVDSPEWLDKEKCSYRGIMELLRIVGIWTSEWVDGIQIPAGDNQYYQVFDNNGNRTWVTTDLMVQPGYEYGATLRSDEYFDNIFFCEGLGKLGINALIPDQQRFNRPLWTSSSVISGFYVPWLSRNYKGQGVFNIIANNYTNNKGDNSVDGYIGFRLAKF